MVILKTPLSIVTRCSGDLQVAIFKLVGILRPAKWKPEGFRYIGPGQ